MVERLGGGAAASAAAAAAARACLSTRLRPDGFAGRPLFSVLLEYFKRPAVVTQIAEGLRRNCDEAGVACELVVNVDNPHEAGAWAAEVGSGFVVAAASANVHESRGYNRAARLARGRYLVIWQDDQLPPDSGQWLLDVAKLFASHPRLGILGLNTYRLCRPRERGNRWGPTPWDPDPVTGLTWSYAHMVDFAPMAVRAELWRGLGGLEEGWARRGDCGIAGDWEFVARAWVAGYTVGYKHLPGIVDDGEPGSTHLLGSSEACWGLQAHVGREALRLRYANDEFFFEMCERTRQLNLLSFKLTYPDLCPYGKDQTKYGNCTPPAEPDPQLLQQLLAGGPGGGAGAPHGWGREAAAAVQMEAAAEALRQAAAEAPLHAAAEALEAAAKAAAEEAEAKAAAGGEDGGGGSGEGQLGGRVGSDRKG